MTIEINDKVGCGFDKDNLKQIISDGVEYLVKNNLLPSDIEVDVSLAVVDLEEIEKINSKYRKKEVPTDILSFCYEKNEKLLNGELIINFDVIDRHAKEYGVSQQQEVVRILIHGVLHLTGYEHSKEMFDLQKKIIKFIENEKNN